MSNIRYICISDLHLGASNSILTPEALGGAAGITEQPMQLLAECLRDLAQHGDGHKPQLIINGDLLEMALTTMKRATLVFDAFLARLIADRDWLFDDQLVFLAGNHDHHLWEGAREVWYRHQLRTTSQLEDMEDTPHVTNLDGRIAGQSVNEPYIAGVLSRREQTKQCTVLTPYPNFMLRNDSGRTVLFHHGHYIEPIYSLISEMRGLMFPGSAMPNDVAELEAENFAWIDFFWSTLGRSGAAGEDLFLIYDKLHDLNAMKSLMAGFATGLLTHHKGAEWTKRLETAALQGILDATLGRVARLELHQAGVPLSPSAAAGLQHYVQGPLHTQLLAEVNSVPDDLTLILGHTHKPFESALSFDGYSGTLPIYNTGGYVVDTPVAEHCHGGAIVVIDDDLNVASIRVYYEPADDVKAELKVVSLHENNPLVAQLETMIARTDGPWAEFMALAGRSALLCRERMRVRIEAKPQISTT